MDTTNEIDIEVITPIKRQFEGPSKNNVVEAWKNQGSSNKIKLVSSNKSDVWLGFDEVIFEESSVPFVKCRECDTFFTNNKLTGTTVLRRHLETCKKKGLPKG